MDRIKSLLLLLSIQLLSLFTVYDCVCDALERPSIGMEPLINKLLNLRRKATETFWSFCLVLASRQISDGLNEVTLLSEARIWQLNADGEVDTSMLGAITFLKAQNNSFDGKACLSWYYMGKIDERQ
ncbi:hypothetical protein B0H34DRAFT_676290 [Crassisporium funariophilum]|nr:hypothetical protein B0H34DRAFT_676290 [Crassisporium funariophilum]